MRSWKLAAVAAFAAFTVLGAACSSGNGGGGSPGGGSFSGVPMTAAGATFPDPVYELWFRGFPSVEPDAKINYQAIGSGGGIEQLQENTVDFGASDAPLQDDEIKAFTDQNRKILEFPTVLGGVAVAYNVKEISDPLKLDGPTVADMFLGKVTNWNDAAIAKLNPGVNLPDLPIQVCHRADESGTTFVFTNWLAQESAQWESQVGADKAVQWPVGNGGSGNDGVAACTTQADGAVGYVEYQYAVTTNLGVAELKGKNSSDFVAPSVEAISAAAGNLSLPIQPTTNVLNSDASGAYPISSTTYLLIPVDLTPLGKDKAQTLVDFLYWALTQGQAQVQSLNYAPLPDSVAQADLAQLDQLQYNGQTLAPSSAVKA
ncbi:MAG TPA: phosphate ABC transporter substrate-binding protein PstS [Actinomycetota bacterium]